QGAQGPQGPQGAQGPQGPIGSAGPQGPAGPTGVTGATGPQGPAGPVGIDVQPGISCTAYNGQPSYLQLITAPDGTVLLKCPNPTNKVVFISSMVFNGNLGGQPGADAWCQTLASAAGLSGAYKAWIYGNDPPSSFSQIGPSLYYMRTDG